MNINNTVENEYRKVLRNYISQVSGGNSPNCEMFSTSELEYLIMNTKFKTDKYDIFISGLALGSCIVLMRNRKVPEEVIDKAIERYYNFMSMKNLGFL